MRPELRNALANGLNDLAEGRIEDGARALTDGGRRTFDQLDDPYDPASAVLHRVNAQGRTMRLFMTRETAENIYEVVDDTFQDSGEFVEKLLQRISRSFEAILNDPSIGKAVDPTLPDLRAVLVDASRWSCSALFYTEANDRIVLVDYINDHYKTDLSGMLGELGLPLIES